MSNCPFEHYFVDYVSGDLDNNEILSFQSHLKNCPTCAQRLDEFYVFHNILKSGKRKEPIPKLIAGYYKSLDHEFSGSEISNNWSQRFYYFFKSFYLHRPLPVRIAEVAGLILIGVLIGWFISDSGSENLKKDYYDPDYFSIPISSAEVEYINYYFQAAELLLLEIKNIDAQSPISKEDFEFNKNIAQKLLIKTFIIHEIALRQNDPKILRFLSKMELLLYEVSNVSSEEINQSFEAFSVIIDDSRLLDDARIFQKDFIRFRENPENRQHIRKKDEVK